MNHIERVTAVLTGNEPDRLPVSVWGHDFLREGSAGDLAQQTIERYHAHDYDFIKINPRWTLFAEPWGNRYIPPTEQKFPRLDHRILEKAADLNDIPVIKASHPAFQEHIEAIGIITDTIGEDVDCLATLFSPLACLGLLAGGVGQPLISFMKEEPAAAHAALEHMTETLTEHALDLLTAGASGIFYAPLQWTSLDVCPEDIYSEYGRRYDSKLLATVASARFNMLHVCGNNIGIARFYDYPVQVLNWDNFGEGNPDLAAVARESGKIVAGGIPHKSIHKLNADELMSSARQSLDGLTSGVLLAGGCGIGATTPDDARNAVVDIANQLH